MRSALSAFAMQVPIAAVVQEESEAKSLLPVKAALPFKIPPVEPGTKQVVAEQRETGTRIRWIFPRIPLTRLSFLWWLLSSVDTEGLTSLYHHLR